MISFLISIFLIWRISLFFVAWLGEQILKFAPRFPYADIFLIPSKLPAWMWSFANFDGVHYLTIAKQGYSAQFTQVFFPLYPLLIKFVNLLFPFLNPIIVSLLISNIFFLLCLIMLWKLLRLDYSIAGIKWMMLFLVFFPMSFFFGSLYTESLFLFLVFAAFYAARQKKWWLAGIFGGLASATRLVGIFLLPALLWEWHMYKIKRQKSKVKTSIQSLNLSYFFHGVLRFALCALRSPVLYLVPLGLISYMIYLQWRFGDWLYFWHVQPIFGAERSGGQLILLPQVVWRYIKMLFTVSPGSYNFWVAFWELSSMVISYWSLVIGCFKNIRISYLIFSFLAITIPTLSGTFSSMPRYILVAFPMFIVLGLIENRTVKYLLFVICCMFLVIFTILFTRAHWVA